MLNEVPNHVAIIMDGNGRGAKAQSRPRIYGHKVGADNIKTIIQAAMKANVKHLSLFAFSLENGNRPKLEVSFLMNLLSKFMSRNTIASLNKDQVCFKGIGFKTKLSPALIIKLNEVEQATKNNTGLTFNLIFNYGGIQDIANASKNIASAKTCTANVFHDAMLTKSLPDVDLLIRTGNEKRISNFLLGECAYAEIIFEKTFWPAYTAKHFQNNLLEFSKRNRRFGAIDE